MSDDGERAERLGHQEVWELLPWYINGTLEGDERQGVERHVERCPLCRGEVQAGQVLAAAVREAAELPLAPGRNLERLMAQLDAEAPARARAAGWWSSTPRPARWALGLQAAALALLVVGLTATLGRPGAGPGAPPDAAPQAAFETLGGAAPPAAAATRGVAVRVVFAPDATAEELRRLLAEVGAQIAAGPSPAGVYTLDLAGGGEPVAAVARLRAAPEVELAERVVVGPDPPPAEGR
jgi:anti-sigma factor RsiW